MKTRAKVTALIETSSHNRSLPRIAGGRGSRSGPRRVLGTMLPAALLMVVAWSTPTTADTAMQTYEVDLKRCSAEMPLPDGTTDCDLQPFYVACLDESVVGEYHVVGNYQEFATPAGVAHIRDNWKVVSMLFGVTTNRVWHAVGVSPGSGNFGPVFTFSTAGNLTYKPLADGPTWQEQFVYKTIQIGDNEPVVNFERDRAKCLGRER